MLIFTKLGHLFHQNNILFNRVLVKIIILLIFFNLPVTLRNSPISLSFGLLIYKMKLNYYHYGGYVTKTHEN
jgi:hypothetical protein